jgi:hypothetical protein
VEKIFWEYKKEILYLILNIINKNQALGDEYVPPVGLPEWKQPSFDDDDHVDPDKYQNAAPQVQNKAPLAQ